MKYKVNSLMDSQSKTNSLTSSHKWIIKINNNMASSSILNKCIKILIKTQMATL